MRMEGGQGQTWSRRSTPSMQKAFRSQVWERSLGGVPGWMPEDPREHRWWAAGEGQMNS